MQTVDGGAHSCSCKMCQVVGLDWNRMHENDLMASIYPTANTSISFDARAELYLGHGFLFHSFLISHLICRRNFYCNTFFFHASNKSQQCFFFSLLVIAYLLLFVMFDEIRNQKHVTTIYRSVSALAKHVPIARYVAKFLYTLFGSNQWIRALRSVFVHSSLDPLARSRASISSAQSSLSPATQPTQRERERELCVLFFMMRLKIMKRNLYSLLLLLKWRKSETAHTQKKE